MRGKRASKARSNRFVAAAGDARLSVDLIRSACAAGVHIDAAHTAWGDTALHWAVGVKDEEAVAALVAAGADVNATSFAGTTPVYECACFGTVDILRMLLAAGGDVNSVALDGMTPLIALLRHNNGDMLERLALFLAHPEIDLSICSEGMRCSCQ